MNENENEIQHLLRELSQIRRAVDDAEGRTSGTISFRGRTFLWRLHLASAVVACMLIGGDLFLVFGPTQCLIETHFSWPLRVLAIAGIGVLLFLVFLSLYFSLKISARRAGEPLEDYVARSLPYLRSMSFASDLFLKFSVLSMLILAGRPDWIAPFCLVGLADYIFQGRFFVLPSRLSHLAGAALAVLGVLQCLLWYGTLLLPSAAALVLSLVSLVQLHAASSTES